VRYAYRGVAHIKYATTRRAGKPPFVLTYVGSGGVEDPQRQIRT
jgi:hypothetical protein